jgi:amino acid adenylation domain-containing protein
MSVANPSVFIGDVSLPRALVAPDDFHPFAWSWLEESIPRCFTRQVALHPRAVAVRVGDATLSYAQLGRRSERLAACLLQRLGHGAEPVAIVTGDDVNAVVAMMGILTAGKFFVAINPASSQLEMQAILGDAGARAIVTDRDGAAAASLSVADPPGLQVFCLDELDVDRDEPLPAIPMTAATYAQIAYTSGSTGAPKGILKTHRALLHQSMTHINGYFITPADRMMAPAPLIFGASLGIVFSALLGGATLLPIRLKSQTAAQLRDWLRDEQVTVYHSVASFFRQFAATLDAAESFPHLRIIKLGGETIQPEDIRLYRQNFADQCVLRVGLASTEAGNYCWHFIGKETRLDGPTVPVGHPLVGTEILLLDEQQEPVAPGEVGEMAVRSAFLASGYWRNPELTQSRFLPDPVDSQKHIYLTGDLGRWRDDGLLEHLGRADQMVKIRGNRVEIGAVEAALLALPAINAAAVVAVEGAGGVKRLVAYVAPAATGRLTTAELRNHLQASLPDYMIPARHVWIEKMPLLPSGKIDRTGLAPPGTARPDLSTPFVAPRSEQEQHIADIWAELLELDEVGVEDNFFELGGDSITALRAALEIEKLCGRPLPANYFHNPTIAALARALAGGAVTLAAPRLRSPTGAANPWPARVNRLLRGRITADAALRLAVQQAVLHMSYPQGMQWLAFWCRQPVVQNRLYCRESDLLRRLKEALGMPTLSRQQRQVFLLGNAAWALLRQSFPVETLSSETLLARLAASRQRFWRSLAALAEQDDAPGRRALIAFDGREHMQQARRAGRGVVLVTYHTPATLLTTALLNRHVQGGPILTLSQITAGRLVQRAQADSWPAGAKGRDPNAVFNARRSAWSAALGMEGLRILRAGGMVQVANEAGYGTAGALPRAIGGRVYRLNPGFAELALATGAAVLPVYSSYDLSGAIRVTFLPPLEVAPDLAATGERVADLVDQYARFVEAAWRAAPASLTWQVISRYFEQPAAGREG